MATIVNNPGPSNTDGSGVGMVIGIILAIIVIALFIIYGVPAMRGGNTGPSTPTGGTNANINVQIPVPSGATNTNGY